MLEARDVSLRLGGRLAVDGASLAVRPGEVLALAGPNGAGKSSLLACLSGALRPSGGAVLVDGAAIETLSPPELARRRAVLEQTPSAFVSFSLRQLVGLAIPREVPPAAAEEMVAAAIASLGLSAMAERRVSSLSGGERHRGHMARALAQLAGGRFLGGGGWLLLDEPTASLDPRHQAAASRAARGAAAEGAGVLAVLHDLSLAAHLADRIALMAEGRIVAVGAPEEVLTPDRLEAVYRLPIHVAASAAGGLAITPNYGATG